MILSKTAETILNYLLITTFIDLFFYGLPLPKINRRLKQPAFLISHPNSFEYQKGHDCSGYASAFVFRHLGRLIDGPTAYQMIPVKLFHGDVPCLGVTYLARRCGYRVRLRTGNLTALKNTVSLGIPVVVLTRSVPGSRALHYIAIVGYDEDNLYAADSVFNHKNSERTEYNRSIPIQDFNRMWKTCSLIRPFFFNLFFEIR